MSTKCASFLQSSEWYESLGRVVSSQGAEKVEALFDAISVLLTADEVMLFYFKPDLGPDIIVHRTDNAKRTRQIHDYKRGFYLTDPFYLALERTEQSGVMSLGELVEDDSFEKSEFYRYHYRATELVDEVCYCMSHGSGGHLLLSFARSHHVGRYSSEDIVAARLIVPLVVAVLTASADYLVDPASISPATTDEINFHRNLKRARSNFGRSVLTDREYEVVQLLLRGYPIDVISERLEMAKGTTAVHRRNIYRKLDISCQAELFTLFIDVIEEVSIDIDSDPLSLYLQPL
ncbi:helix-turn-helix transcriptional regulator [Parahaliea maris]|nr:LuxR C-terminal-related transcriptional regulator [Parahaliea maris]